MEREKVEAADQSGLFMQRQLITVLCVDIVFFTTIVLIAIPQRSIHRLFLIAITRIVVAHGLRQRGSNNSNRNLRRQKIARLGLSVLNVTLKWLYSGMVVCTVNCVFQKENNLRHV